MAVIRDPMPAFELFQPAPSRTHRRCFDRYGSGAWVLAGGLDSFDWLKDRIKRPQAVVDLGGIPELKGIRPSGDGLEIGAMTTLTEVVRHPMIREQYSILLEAAEAAASPQIRNQGTIGGNVSQDTRCWYYRAGWPCYRAGGNICYADTPDAINREHAILDADRCVAVNPSDTAPALIALDAQMVIRTADGDERDRGRRGLLHRSWHRHHADDDPAAGRPAHRHPAARRRGAGARFYFEKVRDRQVWDFALVSVASAMVMSGDGSSSSACGWSVNGVAARPLRLQAVEALVSGRPRNEATAVVASNLAIEGARPLTLQRLQSAADAEPREARHPRRRGDARGHPDLGSQSLGPADPHAHFVGPAVGVALRGCRVSRRARQLHGALRASQASRRTRPTRWRRRAPICPTRIVRHSLAARMFHWVMAASMFTLLFTAFLPIAGVQFAWVTWHWAAGLVLTGSILFHIIHATVWLDFWSIWVGPRDIPELKAEVLRELGHDVPGPRPGKYPLGNRLYHLAIVIAGL